MVYRPYYERPMFNWILKLMRAIPISATRSDVVAATERAREELMQGHVVCIFVEGSVSRTGNLLPFKRGFEHIVDGLDLPIVPVYLDRVWGSIFSFKGGSFFHKWPVRIPYPVTVAFGAPLPSTTKAPEVRLAMQQLGCDGRDESASCRRDSRAAVRADARSASGGRSAMADASGERLTFGRALVPASFIPLAAPPTPDEANIAHAALVDRPARSRTCHDAAGKVPVN